MKSGSSGAIESTAAEQCLLGLLVTWPVQHRQALPDIMSECRYLSSRMLWHDLLLRGQLARYSVGGQQAGMLSIATVASCSSS